MLLRQRGTVRMGTGSPVPAILGSQPRKPNSSWAVPKAAGQQGEGKNSTSLLSMRSHLECCFQIWDLQYKKDVGLLEKIQRRAIKMGRRAGTKWSVRFFPTQTVLWFYEIIYDSMILFPRYCSPFSISHQNLPGICNNSCCTEVLISYEYIITYENLLCRKCQSEFWLKFWFSPNDNF